MSLQFENETNDPLKCGLALAGPAGPATPPLNILQVPDGKGILVTANYGQTKSACMEYNKWIATMVNFPEGYKHNTK